MPYRGEIPIRGRTNGMLSHYVTSGKLTDWIDNETRQRQADQERRREERKRDKQNLLEQMSGDESNGGNSQHQTNRS